MNHKTSKKGMKKVLVFGTFDYFHEGHKSFLRQAKKYGDHLIVVIARDKTVGVVKKLVPSNNERQRLETIKKSGLADKAVLGNLRNKYTVVNKIKPEVICLGYDQKFFVDELQNNLDEMGLKTRIYKLKPYKPGLYKSSKISKTK
jgi:FAD synthetase